MQSRSQLGPCEKRSPCPLVQGPDSIKRIIMQYRERCVYCTSHSALDTLLLHSYALADFDGIVESVLRRLWLTKLWRRASVRVAPKERNKKSFLPSLSVRSSVLPSLALPAPPPLGALEAPRLRLRRLRRQGFFSVGSSFAPCTSLTPPASFSCAWGHRGATRVTLFLLLWRRRQSRWQSPNSTCLVECRRVI